LRARIRDICAVPAAIESAVFAYPAQSASDGIEISGFAVASKEHMTGATGSFDCSHLVSALTIVKKRTEPKRAFVVLSKKSRLETLTSKRVRDLVDEDALVCVPELTGLDGNPPGEFELATNLWMLGRTLCGEWMAEIERIVAQLKAQRPGIAVCLAGVDGMAETALLAAAIAPGVSFVAVDQPLISYRDLISSKTRWSAGEYLPRVLQYFDLAQIIAAIAPRKVSLSIRSTDSASRVRPKSREKGTHWRRARLTPCGSSRRNSSTREPSKRPRNDSSCSMRVWRLTFPFYKEPQEVTPPK